MDELLPYAFIGFVISFVLGLLINRPIKVAVVCGCVAGLMLCRRLYKDMGLDGFIAWAAG